MVPSDPGWQEIDVSATRDITIVGFCVHTFSQLGLPFLPEGTTLRSYLAEKLNCDPMQITKKFAGASCLGKRVYHLCGR